jgi:hypothetical protein
VRVEQEKVEQARFMLEHDVKSVFSPPGFGVGRLARLWTFFAISALPREIWTHACGVMSFAFFLTRRIEDRKIPALGLTALSYRLGAVCGLV